MFSETEIVAWVAVSAVTMVIFTVMEIAAVVRNVDSTVLKEKDILAFSLVFAGLAAFVFALGSVFIVVFTSAFTDEVIFTLVAGVSLVFTIVFAAASTFVFCAELHLSVTAGIAIFVRFLIVAAASGGAIYIAHTGITFNDLPSFGINVVIALGASLLICLLPFSREDTANTTAS